MPSKNRLRIVAVLLVMGVGGVCAPATLVAQTPGRPVSPEEMEAIYAARADSALSRFSAADVAFVSGMIHHHAQAITMSEMAPTHGASPTIRTLAARIINGQVDEIVTMQEWLAERGQAVPDVPELAGHSQHAGAGAGGQIGQGVAVSADADHTGHMEMGHAVGDHAAHMEAAHAAGEHAGHMEMAHGAGDHAAHMEAAHAAGEHAGHMEMGHGAGDHAAGPPDPAHGEADHAASSHADMPGMLTPAQMAQLDAARGQEFDRLYLTMMILHHEGAVMMVEELVATDGALQDIPLFRLASDIQAEQRTEIERMSLMLKEMTGSPLGPALLEVR